MSQAVTVVSHRKKKINQNAWALSYGDMVTALLCFFIIFYALEKQMDKKAKFEDVKLQSHATPVTPEVKTELDYAMTSLEKIPGISMVKTSGFLDINFQKIVFFDKGRYVLTAEGKQVIDEVFTRLKDIDGKYFMEIKGYTDSTPVGPNKRHWWKTNMELSVLRALNVYNYISDVYVSQKNLSVAGHGAHHNETATPDTDVLNRKVSLRLQVIK